MHFAHDRYDAIVVGGGPAGSTAANLIAQKGHRVLLVERSAEPQFKIGESLMPATYWTFERLGVLDAMRRSPFCRKHSVQFFTHDSRASAPFYFSETDPHESSQTRQVVRSEFDQLLLDGAAEQGAEVHRGVAVREVLFDRDRGNRATGVRVSVDGDSVDLESRVVVDATGQSTLIAKSLGLKSIEPNLKHVAMFSWFEGAKRDPGIDGGATLILHTENKDSWFWFIPLPNDTVSIGVVGSVDHLIKGRPADPQKVFEEELAKCAALEPRLEGARQAMDMKVIKEFSYRSREIAGDGWVLVGDAYGFIDPIYSTGVFLALKSAEMAADTICAGLAENDVSGDRLRAFGPEYAQGVDAMRRLVYAFYDRDFSFGTFLKQHPECRRELVHMLVGNVFREPVDRIIAALAETTELPDLSGMTVPQPDSTTQATKV